MRRTVFITLGIVAETAAVAAGVRAGTPLPSKVPPPSTEATLTAQQAAIGGAYIAPGSYATKSPPAIPVPIAVEDTQSPGDEPDPQNARTSLVREWEIMGPADDGGGLLAGSRESLRRHFVRILLTILLVGGAGYWVFRRAQKYLDATLRGWGLPVD